MSLASLRIYFNKLQWFSYDFFTSLFDWLLWLLQIPIKGTELLKGGDSKIILFAGESLPPRISRIAKWCKKEENFVAVLICHRRGYFKKFSTPAIDHTFLFRNRWHLMRLMRLLPTPYILHGFAPKSKYPYIAMRALKSKSPGCKFVIDYQDVLAVYYGIKPTQRWLKMELPYEQKCFANADGIVAHSLEPCEGMKIWKIKEKKKRLFFPLYCDNDEFCRGPAECNSDDIHLVYAGGFYGSHRDKAHYGGAQLHWLVDVLQPQKIHLHLYPSPSLQHADVEEYQKMSEKNPFLHFHPAVAQADLPKELSKYHYGLMPFFWGESRQSKLKYKYATTLKLFNYAEAGIPILVGSGVVYQAWIVHRYRLGMVVQERTEFSDVRKIINPISYPEQVKQVLENREKLSLKRQIPRLIEFYNSINKN